MDQNLLEEFRSLKRFLMVVGFGAFVALLFTLASPVIHVFVMLYAGVLFALLLGGLAGFVERWLGLSYRLAIVGVLATILIVSLLGGWFLGNRVSREISLIHEKAPRAQQDMEKMLKNTGWGRTLMSLTEETEKLWSLGSGVAGNLTGFFSETVGVVVSMGFVIVAGIYISLDPKLYVNGLLQLFPPSRREEVREALESIGKALQKWLVGRFVVMVTVGLLTTIGLLVAGIPGSLALGLLAGLMTFIPFLGPIIAVIPAFLVALIESPMLLVPVAIVFVVVHSIGGYVVTPLIQQRAVSLSPVVLLTAQVVIGLLLGIPGIVIATPLTITLIVIVQKTYIQNYLGDSVKVLGED
ncbi:MAG: AI-2E family transporter [Candidatus Acetothermia bacterium]